MSRRTLLARAVGRFTAPKDVSALVLRAYDHGLEHHYSREGTGSELEQTCLELPLLAEGTREPPKKERPAILSNGPMGSWGAQVTVRFSAVEN